MTAKQLQSFFQLSIMGGILWFLLLGAVTLFPEWFAEFDQQIEQVLVSEENEQSEEVLGVAEDDSEAEFALVVRVIDGDTVELESGERVRYVGIDSPEQNSRSPDSKECFADEATAANAELVEGVVVRLEKDRTNRDRYGRLLRYIWVDEVMVNEQLVLEGFATQITYPPDRKYEDRLRAAQALAQTTGAGLWTACLPGT